MTHRTAFFADTVFVFRFSPPPPPTPPPLTSGQRSVVARVFFFFILYSIANRRTNDVSHKSRNINSFLILFVHISQQKSVFETTVFCVLRRHTWIEATSIITAGILNEYVRLYDISILTMLYKRIPIPFRNEISIESNLIIKHSIHALTMAKLDSRGVLYLNDSVATGLYSQKKKN